MFVTLPDFNVTVIEILLRVGLLLVNVALHIVVGVKLVVVNVASGNLHPIGGQETVFDALFQGVRIDRVAKIAVGVHVHIPSRGGRHSQLHGRLVILQQLPPLTLIVGSASVTLVNDDKIEKIRRILLVIGLTGGVVRHERLEDGEIQVAGFRHAVLMFLVVQQIGGDALHGILGELLKVVLRLIGQDVAVADEENAGFLSGAVVVPVGFVKLPANLESSIGLSRASGHREQNALFAFGHCFQHLVDGNFLIVARFAATPSVQRTKMELIAPLVLFRESHCPQLLR